MSKNDDDSEKVHWWPFIVASILVIILWLVYLYIIWFSNWLPKDDKGIFGDTFGALNALFAGLAFAGVIWAILLQRKELELQRKELEDTRAEIKGQKETLQKQNFESSFFHFSACTARLLIRWR